MANLAIKGHATRGNEVIEILEMLGGSNPHNYSADCDSLCFYIGKGTNIIYYDWVNNCYEDEDTLVFTLEEFLEKFPYKVGDKVLLSCVDKIIKHACWDDTNNEVIYKLETNIRGFSEEYYVHHYDLRPYKEEMIVNEFVSREKSYKPQWKNGSDILPLVDGAQYVVKKDKKQHWYEICTWNETYQCWDDEEGDDKKYDSVDLYLEIPEPD